MPLREQADISDDERLTFHKIEKLFSELTIYRNLFAGQWEEAAILLDTDSRNTFFYGSYNFPGMKKTHQQVDATGRLALSQFCAICDSLVTPKNRNWHGLTSDEYVMKDKKTRAYFQQLTDILFDYRRRPAGNFAGQNYSNWKSLGTFGNACMYVDALDNRWHQHAPGLRYKAVPLGECFWRENHQGIVTELIRWFRLTAAQAVEKFGEEWLPATLKPALDQNLQTPFQFLHCVMPRGIEDFDPERLDAKGKPFVSYYASIDGKCLVAPEGGYKVFPFAIGRYEQMPGEQYARGPAQLVLPSLKTLNAQKSTHLKVGHRVADPIYLVPDDGMIDFDQTPGAMNKGGVTADGRPLVHILPPGDPKISEMMMGEERSLIEGHFLTGLFKTLYENPNMTATQVVELLNERGMLVAPTLGRLFPEFVGGLVPREISLLQQMRVNGRPIIPPPPPRLKEAMGHYEVLDTTPLAEAANATKAAGFMRWVEFLRQVALDTQRPDVMDRVNFDRASPAVARINMVPEEWVSTDQEIAAVRKNRAQQQARQEQIQALPAQAAMLKARSTVAKNELGNAPMQNVPGQGQAA